VSLGKLCFNACNGQDLRKTTALIKVENVCCSGSQDYVQVTSDEKLRNVEFVQWFASAAGQIEHAAHSVSATASTESDLHVLTICHQQNHLQQNYKCFIQT